MMWFLSRIGSMELVFLFLALVLAACFGRRGLRWTLAVGPLLLLTALVSGPDLLSTLVVFIPLALAFGLGVYWGPRLNSPMIASQSGGGLGLRDRT